jgi:YD repeat-containing protein
VGLLPHQKPANNGRSAYCRYALGDPTSITYDNLSRLTQASDPTGTYGFSYDNLGRLVGTSTTYSFLLGRTLTTSYTYDAASNRVSFTDPEGGTTNYTYDSLNRLTGLDGLQFSRLRLRLRRSGAADQPDAGERGEYRLHVRQSLPPLECYPPDRRRHERLWF